MNVQHACTYTMCMHMHVHVVTELLYDVHDSRARSCRVFIFFIGVHVVEAISSLIRNVPI